MSRIYFHTQHDGSAELRGSERAYANCLTRDMALAVLRPHYVVDTKEHPAPIRELLQGVYVTNVYPPGTKGFAHSFATWFGVGDGRLVLPDGTQASTFDLALNTAQIMGSDPIRLLARLHAQSEVHCYVEGEDRAWLADLIVDGRSSGVLRADQGWEDVATLLALRDDEPVVCSYSVCESFPNASMAVEGGYCDNLAEITDELYDEFYELEDDVRWGYAMEGLRRIDRGHTYGLRIGPSTWGTYRYGSKLSAFDIDEILVGRAREVTA